MAYNMNPSFFSDTYQSGDAYFCCDICAGTFRRSKMLTTWNNLRVDRKCYDPRPPQMLPLNLPPEGVPFPDARPQQDNGDRLQDITYLDGKIGTIGLNPNNQSENGQTIPPGGLSPRNILQSPQEYGANILEDDITFITGVVPAPNNN